MLHSEIINLLKSRKNDEYKAVLSKFGINVENALGISTTDLKEIAKKYKKNHQLAMKLWETPIHEVRIFAILLMDYKLITPQYADLMVKDINSWDLCDQACMKLFCYCDFALELIEKWVLEEDEYIRRAAFATIVSYAIHNKTKDNDIFLHFLELIKTYSYDERNFVKKAVNWALRQIGKRNIYLHQKAIQTALYLLDNFKDSKSAQWIANDALKELNNEKVTERILKSKHN